MRPNSHCRRALTAAIFAIGALAPSAFAQQAEQAHGAEEFLDFIGIVGNNPDVLGDLGIRHVRNGRIAADFTNAPKDNTAAYDKYGITAMMGSNDYYGSGPGYIPYAVSGQDSGAYLEPGAVDIVEGPNEVDIFGYSYPAHPELTNGIDAAAQWQIDVYAAMKGSAATKNIPVASWTFGQNYWQGRTSDNNGTPFKVYNGKVTAMDLNNYHDYHGSNAPHISPFSYGSEEDVLNAANRQNPNGVPCIIGETGYATGTYDSPGHVGANTGYRHPISQKTQAKYIPRMFSEFYVMKTQENLKLNRVYSYDLYDKDGETYGLIQGDGTKKPAYFALKNLLTTLSDATWDAANKKWNRKAFTPASLAYTITATDTNNQGSIQHVLLQKSSGDFYLLLWNRAASFRSDDGSDTGGGTDIDNADVPVRLSVPASVTSATQYRIDPATGTQTAKRLAISSGAITLGVPDSVVIVRLTAPKVNLLSNGGFESGSAGWGLWGASVVSSDAHAGSAAVKITGSGYGCYRTVTGLKPGTTYVLSGYLKADGVGGDDAYLWVQNADGTYTQTTPVTGTAYTASSVTFTTGASQTSASLGAWKDVGSGSAWADDLTLTAK